MISILKVQKIGFVLFAILAMVLLLCGFVFAQSSETLDELEKQNEEYMRILQEKENQISDLKSQLTAVSQELTELKSSPLIGRAQEIAKYIDLKNDKDFQKTVQIATTTPLDLKTASIVVRYSNQLNISSSLLLAVIELESSFDQYCTGDHEDRGYCQIIPDTEKWLADSYGQTLGLTYDPSRIYEPEYNIGLGALYLYHLQKSYGSNYHKILSEYNRGPYNLQKYYREHRTYETAYSRGVLARAGKYESLQD